MNGRREKVTFEQNVPVTVTLQYPQGRIVSGNFGEQVMFSLMGNQIMFLDLAVAQKINMLEVQAGESITIIKRNSKMYDVNLTPGTETMRKIRSTHYEEEPESPVMTQMRGTMANIQEGRPPAAPRPMPVPVNAGASVTSTRPSAAPMMPVQRDHQNSDSTRHSNPLVDEANNLVDVYAAVLDRALKQYQGRIKPEEVRSIVLSAYIQQGKAAKYAAA
jgi:hypothetical protein